MKNYWLDNKEKDDLVFWNNHQYIQAETLQAIDSKEGITSYQVTHTPVIPGTMTGTICWTCNNCGLAFVVSSVGGFAFNYFDKQYNTKFDISQALYPEANLDCETGVLELYHHTVGKTPTVVVSYEYKTPQENK